MNKCKVNFDAPEPPSCVDISYWSGSIVTGSLVTSSMFPVVSEELAEVIVGFFVVAGAHVGTIGPLQNSLLQQHVFPSEFCSRQELMLYPQNPVLPDVLQTGYGTRYGTVQARTKEGIAFTDTV